MWQPRRMFWAEGKKAHFVQQVFLGKRQKKIVLTLQIPILAQR
jgi:hypothetical protein